VIRRIPERFGSQNEVRGVREVGEVHEVPGVREVGEVQGFKRFARFRGSRGSRGSEVQEVREVQGFKRFERFKSREAKVLLSGTLKSVGEEAAKLVPPNFAPREPRTSHEPREPANP